jgi:hypothetical protein
LRNVVRVAQLQWEPTRAVHERDLRDFTSVEMETGALIGGVDVCHSARNQALSHM